jgi:hypothetical protein
METKTLKQALQDWTNIDIAQFHLAVSLGIMHPDVSFPTQAKHVFWTNNTTGNALYDIMEALTSANVLQKRDEPDFQYRWDPNFKGSWEKDK